jgi:predicted site-specific integrase-resolvase
LYGDLNRAIYGKKCEKVFQNQSEYIKHKKKNHAKLVKLCNKFTNGTCNYGNERCWFRHNDIEIIKENENEEVVQGILKMMEKMTERIFQMEMDVKNHKTNTMENEDKVLKE